MEYLATWMDEFDGFHVGKDIIHESYGHSCGVLNFPPLSSNFWVWDIPLPAPLEYIIIT